MPQDLFKEIKKEVIGVFDEHICDPYLLILFGSCALKKLDRTSDVDLAIYSQDKIPPRLIANIREELEHRVHTLRSFDIVNLTEPNTSPDLLENILSRGKLWKKTTNSRELLKSLKKRLVNIKR